MIIIGTEMQKLFGDNHEISVAISGVQPQSTKKKRGRPKKTKVR